MSTPSYFILAALLDGALHGYGTSKKVAALSEGRVQLAAGTLSGAPDRLADEGLLATDGQGRSAAAPAATTASPTPVRRRWARRRPAWSRPPA